jgi:hypothetical protein
MGELEKKSSRIKCGKCAGIDSSKVLATGTVPFVLNSQKVMGLYSFEHNG